jgi:hypothetical protein
MIHPGLENLKSSELSEEDIYLKISELNKRMGIAYQQNRDFRVLSQLRALLEHYEMMIQEIRFKQEQDEIASNPDLNWTSIDIDWPDPAEEKEKKKKDAFDY